jgi:hypothetical protein
LIPFIPGVLKFKTLFSSLESRRVYSNKPGFIFEAHAELVSFDQGPVKAAAMTIWSDGYLGMKWHSIMIYDMRYVHSCKEIKCENEIRAADLPWTGWPKSNEKAIFFCL